MVPRPADLKRIAMQPEFVFWSAGLLILALTDPTAPPLVDACLLKHLGVSACPGCGLGHGVTWLLHGNWTAAVQAHPLSPFMAVAMFDRLIRTAPRRQPSRPRQLTLR